jgi:hypothetical protein
MNFTSQVFPRISLHNDPIHGHPEPTASPARTEGPRHER